MQVIYKDKKLDVPEGTLVKDLLKEEIEKSELEVAACRFNNEVRTLNYKIKRGRKA